MNMKRGAWVLAGLVLIMLMLCAFTLDVDNGDKVTIFNNIKIPEGTTVNGDAVAIFGNITVNGSLSGDVVAIFGNVSVIGSVEGDAVAIFGKISVEDGATIRGDAVGIAGGVEKSPGALITGEIADADITFDIRANRGLIPRISYGDMISLFAIYALSCLALLIAPDRIRHMSEESRLKPGRRFGIGFAVMLLFIPASVILSVFLAITLIGIIFIPIIYIVFALLVSVGMIAVEVAIGHRITGHLEGRYSMYIYLLVGVIIVYAFRVIPILGLLGYLALTAYSIGIAVDTKLGAAAVKKHIPNV